MLLYGWSAEKWEIVKDWFYGKGYTVPTIINNRPFGSEAYIREAWIKAGMEDA